MKKGNQVFMLLVDVMFVCLNVSGLCIELYAISVIRILRSGMKKICFRPVSNRGPFAC